MLLKDLSKVWVSEYEVISNHGEKSKKWKYKDIAYLNSQQDVNELDRKPTGKVDYSIINARTDRKYDIKKGNGISITDITKLESFKPDYTVTDAPQIGHTTLFKLEKYNGN